MRRMTFVLLLLLSILAKGQNIPLSQALARLNEQQEEWTITFVADELEGLMADVVMESEQIKKSIPELRLKIHELEGAKKELEKYSHSLEELVEERTADLCSAQTGQGNDDSAW